MVRRMRLVMFLALMLVGLMAATTAGPVGAATVYAAPDGSFAIGVADGWAKVDASRGQLAAWSVDGGAALFTIVHANVPAGTTNLDYAKANIDSVSSINGYTEIRRDFIKCADQDCPLLDYTVIDENGETQRIQQAFATKGSDGWVLTFRTRASDAATYKSDAELMVYSFTI